MFVSEEVCVFHCGFISCFIVIAHSEWYQDFWCISFFLPSYFLGKPFIIFILAGQSEDLLFKNFAGSIKNVDSPHISIGFCSKSCFCLIFLTDFVGEVWC